MMSCFCTPIGYHSPDCACDICEQRRKIGKELARQETERLSRILKESKIIEAINYVR